MLLKLLGISNSRNVIMRSCGWYYKDRLGRTRGPLQLITLKTAWGAGIIDKSTFIWGEDMDEWAPIHMVYGLERAVAIWEAAQQVTSLTFINFKTKSRTKTGRPGGIQKKLAPNK
ncbi:hypothetical protein MKX01_030130 [Papaver californicum]|nr:hypothetical protein MKX01_030130 [Papaver californicum]